MRQSHWCLYIPTHTSVCICVVRCVCARASRQAKRKKCKFLLILTLYALCVYMSCKYIYIYMHICISIYMHINIIYTHIRIYTCIYIYVYIYIYAFLFNMLETVVWGQSKFFPIYFDSPNDLEICLSFFAISFYRMRRGYNRTRNPIDSVFIILSFTFYLFFFFCIVHYYVFLSTFHSIASYLGSGHFRNIFECKYFRRIEVYSFFFCILFHRSKLVFRLAGKKKEKKVIHANTFYVIYIVDWKKRSRERQFSLSWDQN